MTGKKIIVKAEIVTPEYLAKHLTPKNLQQEKKNDFEKWLEDNECLVLGIIEESYATVVAHVNDISKDLKKYLIKDGFQIFSQKELAERDARARAEILKEVDDIITEYDTKGLKLFKRAVEILRKRLSTKSGGGKN